MSDAGAARPEDAAPPDAASEPSDAAAPDAGPPPSAADAAAPNDELITELRRDSSWQNGYCSSVSVHNAGTRDATWQVELVVLGRLSDHWSCNVSGERGRVVFSGVEWNRSLPAGQRTEFGFCVSR